MSDGYKIMLGVGHIATSSLFGWITYSLGQNVIESADKVELGFSARAGVGSILIVVACVGIWGLFTVFRGLRHS